MSITSPEQLNIELIARRLNIEVTYSHKISKCAEFGGLIMIRINKNISKAEQRQEFAHELCHLLRHSGNQTVLPFPFVQLQEWQAMTFTLHFCMPTFMLEELDLPFDRRLAIHKAAQLFNVEHSFAEKRLALWETQMMGVMYRKSLSLL